MTKKTLLRDKLKEVGLKLTDLAEMLDLSRPTLYTLIENYELGQRNRIEPKILKFFQYIDENENIGRLEATRYLFEKITTTKIATKTQLREQIENLLEESDEEKLNFIEVVIADDFFNPIIPYLNECYKIIERHNRSKVAKEMKPGEEKKIAALTAFYAALGIKLNIKNNKDEKWKSF